MSFTAGFGNTVYEILYASVVNGRTQGITCKRNCKKPSPTAKLSFQVTMEAPTQHISTRAAFKTHNDRA